MVTLRSLSLSLSPPRPGLTLPPTHRLSVLREIYTDQHDQWSLLLAVIVSERGVQPASWISAFKRVNLHPDHRLPIEVWLSKICAHIGSSAGAQADDPHGPAYLRNIQIPGFYSDLSDSEKATLMNLVALPFDFSKESMAAFPASLRSLLSKNDNLARIFAYRNGMAKAVELGLALDTDLTPTACLERLGDDAFEDRATAENKARLQNLDYLRSVPHLKSAYESFYGPFGCEKTAKHSQSDVQAAIGGLLEEAMLPSGGRGRATHRHNQFGEAEGSACIANEPGRLLLLHQETMLRAALEEIKGSKQASQDAKKATKSKKKAIKAAKRHEDAKFRDLLVSAGIVDVPEPFAKKSAVTVKVLKDYIKEQDIAKFAPKKGGRPALLLFFTEMCNNLVGPRSVAFWHNMTLLLLSAGSRPGHGESGRSEGKRRPWRWQR